jgi:hypothetical protein
MCINIASESCASSCGAVVECKTAEFAQFDSSGLFFTIYFEEGNLLTSSAVSCSHYFQGKDLIALGSGWFLALFFFVLYFRVTLFSLSSFIKQKALARLILPPSLSGLERKPL